MGMVPPKIEPMPNDPQKRREWYMRNMALYRRLEGHQRGMFDSALYFLAYFVAAVAIAAAVASEAMGATPIESTYRVKVPEGGGASSYGTGTAISENHVLTNSHVVGGKLCKCTVFNALGSHEGTVIAGNPQFDMALIYVGSGGLSHVPIAASDPQEGEQVTIYGFGSRGVLRGQSGKVKPIRGTLGGVVPSVAGGPSGRQVHYGASGGIAVIETDIAIEPGDSGCGLFNERGELCAVQWGNQGNSHATGISHLQTLSQAWETQCGNGQCLPWSRGGGVYIGGGISAGGYQYGGRPLVPVKPPTQRPPVTPPPTQPQQPSTDLLKLAQEFDARLKAVEGRKACACEGGGCQCDGKAVTGQINQQQQNITQIGVRLDALNQSLAGLKPCACDKTPRPSPPPVTKKDPCDIDKLTEEVLKRLPPQVSYFEIKRRTPKR